jgi:hypothetical protein
LQAQCPRDDLAIGELINPIPQGEYGKRGGVELLTEGKMEVPGNQAVTPLLPDGSGKFPDNLPVVPALKLGFITGTTGPLQTGPDPQYN